MQNAPVYTLRDKDTSWDRHFTRHKSFTWLTLSTAWKFLSQFFRKWSFFDQNKQPLNNVEPLERIPWALLIAQCTYKFSSFLDLRNALSRFRLFARDFRRFRFCCSGSACFSKVPPPGNLQSWVKYNGKFESFGKEFRCTKFNAVERVIKREKISWERKRRKISGVARVKKE